MKIVVVYGSARKNGRSVQTAKHILERIQRPEDEVQEYWTTQMNLQACMGCFACRKEERCVRKDDMAVLYGDIVSADFVIFSSPVFMYDVSGSFKMMLDRLYPMCSGNPGFYVSRHPGIKCIMVYAQGGAPFMFRNAVKVMKSRLKHLGFNTLAHIRTTLTVDVSQDITNKTVLALVDRMRKSSERKVEQQIESVAKAIGR